jgi:hypothetical protein
MVVGAKEILLCLRYTLMGIERCYPVRIPSYLIYIGFSSKKKKVFFLFPSKSRLYTPIFLQAFRMERAIFQVVLTDLVK